jgi:hypothetical protein
MRLRDVLMSATAGVLVVIFAPAVLHALQQSQSGQSGSLPQLIEGIGVGIGAASGGIGLAFKLVKGAANPPSEQPGGAALERLDGLVAVISEFTVKVSEFMAVQQSTATEERIARERIARLYYATTGRGDRGEGSPA